jgi:hypothetical protein
MLIHADTRCETTLSSYSRRVDSMHLRSTFLPHLISLLDYEVCLAKSLVSLARKLQAQPLRIRAPPRSTP